MMARFNPNTNPYADEILRLVHIPKSRFTTLEKMTSAAVLGAKLYGLEILEQPRIFWRWPHGSLFTIPHGSNSPVWVEVLFETEKHEVPERLRDLEMWADWLEDRGGRPHLIALKAGNDGLIELYNGLWQRGESWKLITSRLEQDTVSDFEQSSSEPIPRRTDEESSAAYFGRSSIQGGGGGRDGGFGGGGGGGGDGGSDGGDGPQGQTPGAGGVREMLNHPVLFSADKETLRAILENS